MPAKPQEPHGSASGAAEADAPANVDRPAGRAARPERHLLHAGRHRIQLSGAPPSIMAILNIGSDSVADPLHLHTLAAQVERAEQLHTAGAQIIDIGVQSARTDTAEISVEQELDRLLPLVRELSARGRCLSIDSWRAEVAEAAIDAGASIINDVSALADPRMAEIAARTGAALVITHTRALPKQRHFPEYRDLLADVLGLLGERSEQALALGLGREQLLIDPGLDFAKSPQDSIELLRSIDVLHQLRLPILLAASRKYFLGMLTGRKPVDRLAGTLAAVAYAASKGVHVVRAHDVQEVSDLLRVQQALLGSGAASLIGDPDSDALRWIAPKS